MRTSSNQSRSFIKCAPPFKRRRSGGQTCDVPFAIACGGEETALAKSLRRSWQNPPEGLVLAADANRKADEKRWNRCVRALSSRSAPVVANARTARSLLARPRRGDVVSPRGLDPHVLHALRDRCAVPRPRARR